MKKIQKSLVAVILTFSLMIPTLTVSNEVEAKKKTYVYYARYSKKYHCYRGCRTLARSKKVYKVTKKKAKSRHLTKCKVCY